MRAILVLAFIGCGIGVGYTKDIPPNCGSSNFVQPVRTSILNTKDYYPSSSLLLGEEGTATVIYTVREDGKVEDAYIKTSSGNKSLDDASIDVTQAMVFQPALLNGNPTACRKGIRLQWLLPDGGKAAAVLAELQKNAVVVQAPLAEYPESALEGHETGITVVKLHLLASGEIRSGEVHTSSGSPDLDSAALRYAQSGAIASTSLIAKVNDGSVDVGVIWAPDPVTMPGSDGTRQ